MCSILKHISLFLSTNVSNAVNNNFSEIWQSALTSIKNRVSSQSFETWIIPIKPISFEGNTFTLQFPNLFFKDWVTQHYKNIIEESISNIANTPVQLNLTINPEPEVETIYPSSEVKETDFSDASMFQDDFTLNPKYTFENFVVGHSNRFASAACLAVAEAPAKSYNPLFIYGGVGLGKTHLLHAIGRYVKKNNANAKVTYITSEKFMNEMISGIQLTKMLDFREKYRNVDVLLIDDIQFLAGKEATQEEFFHTFNALYEANKQIVTTSDSHPKEIKLEERLRSRFEMGLVADIQQPDLETRVAILLKKAELEKVTVPRDVLLFIANKVVSNIRVLEGALVKICAYASLTNTPITVDMAEEALADSLKQDIKDEVVNIDRIKQVVVDFFGLRLSDLTVRKRTRKLAFPRQIAMYLTRELTDKSLPEIGENFGKRDHTTVLHAYETIKNKIETDKNFYSQVNQIIDIIKGDKR